MRDEEQYKAADRTIAPPSDLRLAQEPEPTLERGIALRDTGQLAQSLNVLRMLVARQMRREGRYSYDTQCALSQLGRTLRAMGRTAEACSLHWEVLAIRVQVYGPKAFFSCNSAGILIETLQLNGNHATATEVRRWINPPKPLSPPDAVAIESVERKMNRATAARHAYVAMRAANLIQDFIHPQY